MRRSRPLRRRTPLRARSRLRERRGPRLIALQTREALVRRARGRCERCDRMAPPLDAHHRRMRSQGGSDALENLSLLCRRCHNHVHDNRGESVADGWIIQRKVARLPDRDREVS